MSSGSTRFGQRLRDLVLEGGVGAVEHVQWNSFAGIWGPERQYGWSFDASLGGGWLHVHGSHNIDFIRWTFGEVTHAAGEVRTTIKQRPGADGSRHECTGEDGFIVRLQTDRGASVLFDATATAPVDVPVRVTVVGSDGVLEMLSENVHEMSRRLPVAHRRGDLGRASQTGVGVIPQPTMTPR